MTIAANDMSLWKALVTGFGEPAEHVRAVKQALDDGANPNGLGDPGAITLGRELEDEDWEKEPPLHFAAAYAGVEIVRALLDAGAEVDRQSRDGHTALYKATDEVLPFLLARGAVVDVVDHEGATPLVRAAGQGRLEAVQLLIAAGARVSPKKKRQPNALEAAADGGHAAVAQLLRAHGAPLSDAVLIAACRGGLVELVTACLDQGSAPDTRGALNWAAACGHAAVVDVLVGRGANVDQVDPKMTDRTPLGHAISSEEPGSVDVLVRLLAAGAQLGAVKSKWTGGTALHRAALALADQAAKIQILLDHGVDPLALDDGRQTASMRATTAEGKLLLEAAEAARRAEAKPRKK